MILVRGFLAALMLLLILLCACCRSSHWATVPLGNGWPWVWRAAMWRCSTTPSLTSTSCTCTKAAFFHSSSPTVVSTRGRAAFIYYRPVSKKVSFHFYLAIIVFNVWVVPDFGMNPILPHEGRHDQMRDVHEVVCYSSWWQQCFTTCNRTCKQGKQTWW